MNETCYQYDGISGPVPITFDLSIQMTFWFITVIVVVGLTLSVFQTIRRRSQQFVGIGNRVVVMATAAGAVRAPNAVGELLYNSNKKIVGRPTNKIAFLNFFLQSLNLVRPESFTGSVPAEELRQCHVYASQL